MKLVQLHKRYYPTPDCWNELTGRQLVAIMGAFEKVVPSVRDAQLLLFKILIGLSDWRMWRVGYYELEDKLYLTDWVALENTLTKNLLPKYRGLYGPADNFDNLRVVEFIFADQWYKRYKDPGEGMEPDIKDLDKLCATLYRPRKKRYNRKLNVDGDVRQPFNENLTGRYAGKIAKWPFHVKLAIFYWYEGCLAALVEAYPEPFSGGDGEPAKYGQWSIMRGVAEKGIHGDINHVENMFLKNYMMECTELVIEGKKIDALYKEKPGSHG